MNHSASDKHLRPIIGVFINKRLLRTRKMSMFAKKLNQANKKVKCSIYFFTSESINWKMQVISGYVFDGNSKKWMEHQLPFPDIIYDRGTGFRGGEKAEVKALRARLKTIPEIQYINSCKLKKWQVHQKLSKHKDISRYLPETIFSRGIDDIGAMIDKYGYLFLKSSGGSGGKGVFALEKCDRGFCCWYYRKGLHQKRYVSDLGGLRTELKKIGLKPDKIIIQQGIRLIKYENRLMDLRVLMVKGKEEIWDAVYNQARVAQKKMVITNASLGGEVMRYNDIYPALQKKYSGIPSEKKIKEICKTIACHIEKEFGPFGEIGIDIGVDETGKVWLLEANSKPSKLPEPGIEDTVGISPQFLLTLEYAKLLYLKKT